MADINEDSSKAQKRDDIGQYQPDEHTINEDPDSALERDEHICRKMANMTVRIVVFLLAIGCLVFGKLSFLSLARDIKILSDSEETACGKAEAYWRMYWVMIIPYLLCLLRYIWHGLGKPRLQFQFPWPSMRSIQKVSQNTINVDFLPA